MFILTQLNQGKETFGACFPSNGFTGLCEGNRAAIQIQGSLIETVAPEAQLVKLTDPSHHIYSKQLDKPKTVGHSGCLFTWTCFMGFY